MKALILEKNGEIDSLKVVNDRHKPIPKGNEIRVKIYSCGLNPSDYQIASYKGIKDENPRILGLDIAGVVDEVGGAVSEFKVGDRVYYLRSIDNPDGGFAEYACVKADLVSKLPDNVCFAFAAAAPGSGFTAYQAIVDKLRPIKEKTILIHGGAGGVGSYAIQLAKRAGLKVYTTCAKREIEYVKDLGADIAVDYQNEDIYEIIAQNTGNMGVSYILNTLNSASATKDLDILAFGGEIAVTAGFPDFNKIHFYDKGLSIHEIAFGAALTSNSYDIQCNVKRIGDEFARLMSNKEILPPKITEISLNEVPEYLIKMRNGEITGKVVTRINK